MTDEGLTAAASLVFAGLILNGCLSMPHAARDIFDEREISKGLIEAACYIDGRTWEYGKCKPETTP